MATEDTDRSLESRPIPAPPSPRDIANEARLEASNARAVTRVLHIHVVVLWVAIAILTLKVSL